MPTAKIPVWEAAYAQIGKVVRAAARADVLTAFSKKATVLEVRAHDEPGLLYRITAAIAGAEVMITGAKVLTLGSEAVDVFFLVDADRAPLCPAVAEAVRLRVLDALRITIEG